MNTSCARSSSSSQVIDAGGNIAAQRQAERAHDLLEGVSIAPLDLVQHRLDVKSTTHLSVPTHTMNPQLLRSPACENLFPL